MKVHPFAELFAMLPQDELEQLAEDIKNNGQRVPCIVDKDGTLIDGRNRVEACKIAGVQPIFETYSGTDIEQYILSVNVHRRHIPKGAQAMAIALVHPEPAQRGGAVDRGKSSANSILNNLRLTDALLSQSRTVLKEYGADSPEVKSIILCTRPLNDVYQVVLTRRKEREAAATDLKAIEDKVKKLSQQPAPPSPVEAVIDEPPPAPASPPPPDAELLRIKKEIESNKQKAKDREEELKKLQTPLAALPKSAEPVIGQAPIMLPSLAASEASLKASEVALRQTTDSIELSKKLTAIEKILKELAEKPAVEKEAFSASITCQQCYRIMQHAKTIADQYKKVAYGPTPTNMKVVKP